MHAWVSSAWGADDLQMWESYAALLPTGSPGRQPAVARVGELAAEFGLASGRSVATSVQRPRN
jgi:hypothetical protein